MIRAKRQRSIRVFCERHLAATNDASQAAGPRPPICDFLIRVTGRPDQLPNTRRTIGIDVAVVAVSIAVVVILLQVGTGLLQDVSGAAPATRPDVNPLREMAANAAHPIARLLLQLLIIIFAARVAGRIAAAMGQPPVIGEIAAGLILGPSIVGALMPGATAFLFAPASLPALQLLSQVGVLLFMFTVGVEFDLAHVRGRTRTAVAVSHFSIAVPFILGVLLAITMYRGVRAGRCAVSGVCVVPRHRDEHHGVPGAGANPRR